MHNDCLDFFLSEMSVSDSHGGGLTLRRVLGPDLGNIERFVFANTGLDALAAPEVRGRSDFVWTLFQKASTGRLIGCRPTFWLFRRKLVRAHYAGRIATMLEKYSPGKNILRGLVCPQNQDVVRALEHLKSRRQIKYITWMMDDQIVSYVGGKWIYPGNFRQLLGKHLRGADAVFVISPAMAEFYERQFGVKSTVLFSPANDFQEPSRELPSTDGILRIAYFGGLWKWQLDGLVRFASGLRSSEQLDLYTKDVDLATRLNLRSVAVKGFLPKEAVRKTMLDYDAVLLPLSFSDNHRNLVELNIATKMSECVASGTITVVFGPRHAAMVRFLEPTGAACAITDPTMGSWPSLVRDLRDVNYRRRVLAAARNLVETELSTEVMHGRWRASRDKMTADKELVSAVS